MKEMSMTYKQTIETVLQYRRNVADKRSTRFALRRMVSKAVEFYLRNKREMHLPSLDDRAARDLGVTPGGVRVAALTGRYEL